MEKNKAEELKKQEAPQEQEEMKLDDARRVKVLSPGMLVFKRFIRNKLAVAGIIILAVMFVFSFIGPLFSPYARAQMFTKEVEEPGDYATGKFNKESRFFGETNGALNSAILKTLGSHKTNGLYDLEAGEEIPFSSGSEHYTLKVLNPSETAPSTVVFGNSHIATASKGEVTWYDPALVDEDMLAFITADVETPGENELDYNGKVISVERSKVEYKYFVTSEQPFAVSTFNIYTALLGKVADLQSDAEFLHSVSAAFVAGETSVDYKGKTYTIAGDAENGFTLNGDDGAPLFNIIRDFRSASVKVDVQEEGKDPETKDVDFNSLVTDPTAFRDAVNAAITEKQTSFNFEEKDYTVEATETEYHVMMDDGQLAMTVANNFDPVESKYDVLNSDFNFIAAAEQAIADSASGFEFDGENYELVNNGDDYNIRNAAGEDIVLVSDIAYGPAKNGIELTVDFIKKLQEAMRAKQKEFTFVDQHGEETAASINLVNDNYYVQTMQKTSLFDSRAPISAKHWLGTDVNGMDVFTRLMYGGRVSLLVGFVVVFFEIIIGVIVGGISGYFGGVVDTILMRFVELFNAIPFYPMLIILGSVMDNMHVGPYTRLMMTMVILGILGWTGIARIVRGQILSLREQDFMIATEATGIRTSRRIFRHLVPNVMPLLIVNATASLGGIILTEATLGFLGLGVKYPMASWGSIINQVNDMQVMKTAWWIWIPAGIFILLTVLGFNFVGDGLRDAFDPKMKR